MKKTTSSDEMTFEQAMARLEEIVTELDRAIWLWRRPLKLFQEGTPCARSVSASWLRLRPLLSSSCNMPRSRLPAAPPVEDNLFGDDS